MAMVGGSEPVHDDCHARLAEAFGMLAAIESEEYAAAHPEEIARRRLFFRRLLEERRSSGRADVGESIRSPCA